MPRGDLTGGPIPMQQEQANGEVKEQRSPVPIGKNPYFAEEGDDQDFMAEDDSAPEDSRDLAESEDQGDDLQAQAQPEPTFDTETDRANGINVDSTEYKHFQSAYNKRLAAEGQGEGDRLQRLENAERQRRAKEKAAQSPGQSDLFELKVDWKGFQPSPVSNDDPLADHMELIDQRIQQGIEYAVSSMNRQSREHAERSKLTQTQQYLTAVIDEIGKIDPGKQSQALDLLEEYSDFARSNPEKWANFAVKSLDIDVTAAQGVSEPQPRQTSANGSGPRKLAQQAKSRQNKPNVPSAVSPRRRVYKSTEEAVEDIVDQHLKGMI